MVGMAIGQETESRPDGGAGRLIISALALSEPGTMGGNSKIALEMARGLAPQMEVHFVLPRHKLPTLTGTLGDLPALKVHALADYPRPDKFHPFGSARHYLPLMREVFRSVAVGPRDIVFSMSDTHVDVLPLCVLHREFGFRLVPGVFLFVPSVFENLRHGYGFPVLRYFICWLYSRWMFGKIIRRATGFVITNDSDRGRFPSRFADRLFACYGGVNVDQIPPAPSDKKYDVVFCSRLHPQKGIDGFLDIWRIVRASCPTARLTVIGNGDPAYEAHLRDKAARLGIADSVDWLGYVNNEAKYAIYAAARVHVHPTVFDNNGMVAAEALCSGLPVVMFDLPPLRHVYTTGCVKVPPRDKKAFANAVIRLLTDPAYYAATAPTSEQVAALRAHWDWSHRVELFRAFIGGLP